MLQPNPSILKELFTTEMPFGKYKGTKIAFLPTHYLEWFYAQGFPKGKLGMLMHTIYEIKLNGLEELLPTIQHLSKDKQN